MEYKVGANYQTNKTTTVYVAFSDNTVADCGTVRSGVDLVFDKIQDMKPHIETKYSTVKKYGRCNSKCLTSINVKYLDWGDWDGQPGTLKTIERKNQSISGYWVIIDDLTFMDESAINGVNPVVGDLRVKVATNKKCPVFYAPNGLVANYRNAGSEMRIFGTYKDDKGIIWGRISDYGYGNDMWIMFKYRDGTLNKALTDKGLSKENLASDGYNIYTSDKIAFGSEDALITGKALNGSETELTLEDGTYYDPGTLIIETRKAAANMSISDEDALEGLFKMQYVWGIPPKITPTSDIQYMINEQEYPNSFGRCYTEAFMQANTVFSIQPGKVKYLPNFSDADKSVFWELAGDLLHGVSLDDETMKNSNSDMTGQLFEFTSAYSDYINSVNLLARVMSIYLGIGDKIYPGSSKKYKYMDYSFYNMPGNAYENTANNIFSKAVNEVKRQAKLYSAAITDDTYIHFYMTADGTSSNEDMQVSTRQSSLESLFSGTVAELARDIEFLSNGSSITSSVSDLASSLGMNVGSTNATILDNIAHYGAAYLQGGRLVFPQMLDDVQYGRNYQGTCRFISTCVDPESIFLHCYLPVCFLLPFVIPQMLSENMYTYPFLARVHSKGLFSCDLAAITNLTLQRGGNNSDFWSTDGLPTEIDASFTITPLYSKLMTTTYKHPILFLQNSALQEYLGAMCGISFVGNQMELKANILATLAGTRVTNVIPSLVRGFYDSTIANVMRGLFNIP